MIYERGGLENPQVGELPLVGTQATGLRWVPGNCNVGSTCGGRHARCDVVLQLAEVDVQVARRLVTAARVFRQRLADDP